MLSLQLYARIRKRDPLIVQVVDTGMPAQNSLSLSAIPGTLKVDSPN